eukprot:403371475
MFSRNQQSHIAGLIAGGHPDRFKFDSEKGEMVLAKKTNICELETYQKIFRVQESHPYYKPFQMFRNFLPNYHGYFEQDGVLNIKLDNLMNGMSHASVLDIKMGTTSITVNTAIEKHERVRAKDALTTSVKLGMRITAMIVKDSQGQVQEKVRKPHGKAQECNIPEFIIKVLRSNEHQHINREALDYFIDTAEKMLEYFVNDHPLKITGSSILLIVDNTNKKYSMKIIDLSSCEEIEEASQRDESYILGIQSLLRILKSIRDESHHYQSIEPNYQEYSTNNSQFMTEEEQKQDL